MTIVDTSTEADYEVIIVGAGPVGLVTACLLGRYGIRTLVVERLRQLPAYPRAVGIDEEALRALQLIGIADEQLAQMELAPTIEYLSPVGYSHFQPPAVPGEFGYPSLATFLQPTLEEALRERVGEYDCVDLAYGTRMVDYAGTEPLAVSLSRDDGAQTTVSCEYLLGCDGGRSRVRECAGIELEGHKQDEKWLVVDTRDSSALCTALGFADPAECTRPVVSISLPDGLRRFECRLDAETVRVDPVPPRFVRESLRPYIGDAPAEVLRATIYERYFAKAAQLRSGSVFLLGDSAHLVPPYGGQGLCSGVRDAVNLAWKLAWVLRGRFGTGLLDTYQVERGEHLTRTVGFVRALARNIEGDGGTAQASVEKSQDRQRQAKPTPDYDDGFFTTDGGGAMFIQPLVTVVGGTERLLDESLDDGFAVLCSPACGIPAGTWRELLGGPVQVRWLRDIPGRGLGP